MTFGELARPDIFARGIELTMAERMTHCDVVLPAATNFECADLSSLATARGGGDPAGRWVAAKH
jgi:anaerobic selenocysteine-containing dehydrogenase